MTISERYRELAAAVARSHQELRESAAESARQALRQLAKAEEQLAEIGEQVGEIPRIRLEQELSPVLLRAHATLDRARLLLEEAGEVDRAAMIWELEQKAYRLLNSL